MGKAKKDQAAAQPTAETLEVGGEAGESVRIEHELATVSMRLPLADLNPAEYSQRHIDLQLKTEHAETLKRITDGLIAMKQKTADGRPVTSAADAIRWVLDGVGLANREAEAAA